MLLYNLRIQLADGSEEIVNGSNYISLGCHFVVIHRRNKGVGEKTKTIKSEDILSIVVVTEEK